MHRCYNDLKSQGIAVSKDSLHAMLAHLEDSFLIRLVSIHTASERKRQSNPRKIYPVDQGLIPAFDRTGRVNTGHALETAVLIELERRTFERAYLHTREGLEIDFIATPVSGVPLLLQVCCDLSAPETQAREFRAISEALREYPDLTALLLTQSSTGLDQARKNAPDRTRILPTWEWMLSDT